MSEAEIRNGLFSAPSLQLSQQRMGVGIGRAVGITVYMARAYLTFVHDWQADTESER
jgi:hypothetical protein